MIRILIILLISVPLSAQVGRYTMVSTTGSAVPPVVPIECSFWFAFNGDLTDEMGGADAVPNENVYYRGDTCLIFSESDGDDQISIGNLQSRLGGAKDFSFSYIVNFADFTVDEDFLVHGSSPGSPTIGMRAEYDATGVGTANWILWSYNGTTGNYGTTLGGAYENGLLDDTEYVICEVYDYDGNGTNAYVEYWVNGVLWNASDTIINSQSPLNLNLTYWFGNDAAGATGLRDGDVLDEIRGYPFRLSPAQIAAIVADPYNLPEE